MERASISITSPTLLGTRERFTDDEGAFAFLALPAGTYRMEVRRIGYHPVRIDSVLVSLGATTRVTPALIPQANQLEAFEVSSARPLVDMTTAASASTLDSAMIRMLPSGRDVTGLLTLVPQGNPSPYGDGVGFGGATGYDNAWYVDGVHTTHPLSAESGVRVPFNFINEVQVLTGGYEAEFGRNQGALVNVVTNSGGNELRTEAVAFFSNNGLRAGARSGLADRAPSRFEHYDVGVGVGGAVRRDRAWFYAAYNPLFETKEVAFPGQQPRMDRLERHLFAGKLTWRAGSNTDATFTILGDPSRRAAVEGAEAYEAPQPNVASAGVVDGDFRGGGWTSSLQVRHQATNRWWLNGSVSWLENLHQHAGQGGRDDSEAIARVDDKVTGTSSGNFGRYIRAETGRRALDAHATFVGRVHTAKVGASLERNVVGQLVYRHSFIDRAAGTSTTWGWSEAHQVARDGKSDVPAVYAQDSWAITDRLRVNAGLRWEGQFIGEGGRSFLRIANEWSPRIGIVYGLGEAGVGKLFASGGRFYEQMPLWAVAQAATGLVIRYSTYPENPLVSRAGGTESETMHPPYIVDATIQGQSLDEFAIGYEQRVGASHVATARGVLRKLNWTINTAFQDFPADLDFVLGNPGRGELDFLPRATRTHRALELSLSGQRRAITYRASYVLSRTFGNVPGEFDSDYRIPASHTTTVNAVPVWWENATGFLPSDRRHLAKLSGTIRVTEPFTVGIMSIYASGLPLSEMEINPGAYFRAFVTPRGTAGRSPGLWTTDLRATYRLAGATRTPATVMIDIQNIGNTRKAIDFEQLHYDAPGRASVNAAYLAPNRYHPPLRVRVGVIAGF